jgi:hypothetical protein
MVFCLDTLVEQWILFRVDMTLNAIMSRLYSMMSSKPLDHFIYHCLWDTSIDDCVAIWADIRGMVLQHRSSSIGFGIFEDDLRSVRKLYKFTDHFILVVGYHGRWIEQSCMLCFERDTHCIYSNIMSIADQQSTHSLREQHAWAKYVPSKSYIW